MTRHFSSRTKVVAVVILLLVGVSGLSVKALFTPAGGGGAANAEAQGRRRQTTVESEVVTLTARGLEPAESTRPAGQFVLRIENRTGKVVTWHLASEQGNRLHSKSLSREEPDWSELLDLRPGSYVLSDADSPGSSCRINITAR